MKKLIIFTDLDGTLLDHNTYEYTAAQEALDLIKKFDIPLIFCTSKTRDELEYHQEEMDIHHPMIVENGAAIIIPKSYFEKPKGESKGKYLIYELGEDYINVRNMLSKLKDIDPQIKGFGDMSVQEIADDTGLTLEAAQRAKQKEYTEPFIISDESKKEDIIKAIEREGFTYTKGGRYHTICKGSDKGKAVQILSDVFEKNKQQDEEIISVGIGDSLNDKPMLEVVDIPIVVQKPDGSYLETNAKKAQGIGPEGWNKSIIEEINKTYSEQ